MKNIITIWVVLLMLTGVSGITVVTHLCQGIKVNVQLFSSDTNKCCSLKDKQNTCHSINQNKKPACNLISGKCSSESNENNKDCCNDEIMTFKIDEVFSIKAKILPEVNEFDILNYILYSDKFNKIGLFNKPLFNDHNHSPPYLTVPIYISFHSFIC